jgi:hypothetical protein
MSPGSDQDVLDDIYSDTAIGAISVGDLLDLPQASHPAAPPLLRVVGIEHQICPCYRGGFAHFTLLFTERSPIRVKRDSARGALDHWSMDGRKSAKGSAVPRALLVCGIANSLSPSLEFRKPLEFTLSDVLGRGPFARAYPWPSGQPGL